MTEEDHWVHVGLAVLQKVDSKIGAVARYTQVFVALDWVIGDRGELSLFVTPSMNVCSLDTCNRAMRTDQTDPCRRGGATMSGLVFDQIKNLVLVRSVSHPKSLQSSSTTPWYRSLVPSVTYVGQD